jgi:hypothetical protein
MLVCDDCSTPITYLTSGISLAIFMSFTVFATAKGEAFGVERARELGEMGELGEMLQTCCSAEFGCQG